MLSLLTGVGSGCSYSNSYISHYETTVHKWVWWWSRIRWRSRWCRHDWFITSVKDVFSEKDANLLPTHRPFDCAIDLIDLKSIPPSRPIYGLTQLENAALNEYIEVNLKKGFIRPSRSPASASIFFVSKKSGELRPCVDYRALNALTIKNRGPFGNLIVEARSEWWDKLRTTMLWRVSCG